MDIFLKKHEESILGVVEGFDRIIFKGYLTSMFPDGAFGRYLSRRGVLLKDAGKFFESETETLIQHAKTTAEEAGRPYLFLASAHTHASGRSKEAMARAIAEQDGISEGLVCIFSVLEPCVSRPGHRTPLRFTSMTASGCGNCRKWVSPSSGATTRFSGCRISQPPRHLPSSSITPTGQRF